MIEQVNVGWYGILWFIVFLNFIMGVVLVLDAGKGQWECAEFTTRTCHLQCVEKGKTTIYSSCDDSILRDGDCIELVNQPECVKEVWVKQK